MLIGGSFASVNGTNRNSLARLNSDGSLDSSFDVGSGTGGSGQVEAMAFQPDGKLMVAGNFNLFNGAALSAIVRLQTNGVLDMTFGVFFDSCVDCGFPDLRGVGVLSNGTIMISGVFNRIETAHWNGLARLNPDGGLDITFNPPVGVDEQVSAMVVGKDDKTTVAIQFSDPSGNGNDARFVRLNPDGSPDASFNPAAVIGLSTGIPVSAMALDSQGRLLIAGQFSSVGGVARHGLARLNQDGTLDATFDSGPGFAGGAPQAAPNSTALVSGVALQDNGGIIVGGNFWIADNQVRLGLARFQADQSGQGGGSSTIQSAARAADGTFSMTILGSSGQSYRVDASSDLRTWTPIGSITGTGAPQSFTDPAAKGIPMRFYRLVNQ